MSDGFLFYIRHPNRRRDSTVAISTALHLSVLRDFQEKPLSDYLGCRKIFSLVSETCYFPQFRQFFYKYVRTCGACHRFNYCNMLPAGVLNSIKTEFPVQIVGFDLTVSYSTSVSYRCRYCLRIVNYFTHGS